MSGASNHSPEEATYGRYRGGCRCPKCRASATAQTAARRARLRKERLDSLADDLQAVERAILMPSGYKGEGLAALARVEERLRESRKWQP
jgi:hypothetical protein